MMLAEAVNGVTQGPLAGFVMDEVDRYALKIAGLLHDCGKVTTPVHVVDKATKLGVKVVDEATLAELIGE